jgi:hypothetical protein
VGQLKVVTLRATVRDGVEVGVRVELEVKLEACGPSSSDVLSRPRVVVVILKKVVVDVGS